MITVVALRRSGWRRTWWMHPELSLAAVAAAAWLAVLTMHIAGGPFHHAVPHVLAPTPEHGLHGHHGAPNLDGVGHQDVAAHSGWAASLPVSVGLWILMTTAMMLPSALPAARAISLTGKWKRRQRGPALFAVGYLAVWSVLGVRPAVRGPADRADHHGTAGDFGGVGRRGGLGGDALEATGTARLPPRALVASRWVASGSSGGPGGTPQRGVVHGLVRADDGPDGAGSACRGAAADAGPVRRGVVGEITDQGGRSPPAVRRGAGPCRGRGARRATGPLAEVPSSTAAEQSEPASRTTWTSRARRTRVDSGTSNTPTSSRLRSTETSRCRPQRAAMPRSSDGSRPTCQKTDRNSRLEATNSG